MPSPFRGFAYRLRSIVCSACLCLPVSAAAQQASAADKAAAEVLFDTALNLMREGKTAEACPKLERSQRIDPGIGTLLYLAECYEKLGRTASAWATFREAHSAAQAAKQTERARMAEERSARLRPLLTKLTIEVAEENRSLPEFTIRRSGQPLSSSLWGLSVPVDPGQLQIEATARGYTTWVTTLELTASGASQTIRVPPLQPLPRAADGSLPSAASDSDAPLVPSTAPLPGTGTERTSARKGNTQRAIAIALGGVGVVGLGLGSYFGVRAIKKNSDAEEFCPAGNKCNDARGVTLTEEASDAAVVSNIAFGLGAAALITGAYLFLTGAPEERSQLKVGPMVSTRGAGITASGAFQ